MTEAQARKELDDLMLRLGEWMRENPEPPLQVGIVHHADDITPGEEPTQPRGWTVAMEWGREAPDSPMIGAAAYGHGDTVMAALTTALGDTRTEAVIHDSEILLAELVAAVDGEATRSTLDGRPLYRQPNMSEKLQELLTRAHVHLGHTVKEADDAS